MARPFKYTPEQIQEAFPQYSIEEIKQSWDKFVRKYRVRNDPHRWQFMGYKPVQCQKPWCEDVSRRLIRLKDGTRMRYCDDHYDDWFASQPS